PGWPAAGLRVSMEVSSVTALPDEQSCKTTGLSAVLPAGCTTGQPRSAILDMGGTFRHRLARRAGRPRPRLRTDLRLRSGAHRRLHARLPACPHPLSAARPVACRPAAAHSLP